MAHGLVIGSTDWVLQTNRSLHELESREIKLIELKIIKKSECSYRYEVIVSGDIADQGHFARPRMAYDKAMLYCTNHGLIVDKLSLPASLKRLWGF
jgi:hypothetical protein